MKRRPRRSPRRDAALVGVAEREKCILARQLHESVLQTLSAASILARVVTIRSKNSAPLPLAEFTQLRETVDAAIDEARLLIRQLQPPDLEKDGLISALQELAASVRGPCQCVLEYDPLAQRQLPSVIAVPVFRIAQEAVRRAVQRSRLAKVAIHLSVLGNRLKLEVEDDGRGNGRAGREEIESASLMQSYASFAKAELRTERKARRNRVICTCRT